MVATNPSGWDLKAYEIPENIIKADLLSNTTKGNDVW